MIYGISGYARTGKDEVGKIFVKNGYEKRAFADKLREAVFRLNPILGTLTHGTPPETEFVHVQDEVYTDGVGYESAKANWPEYRRLLQFMGTEVGRNLFGENFWVDITLKDLSPMDSYVITDVRFPNEGDGIRAKGGKVIYVGRPGVGPLSDHASETSMDKYLCDYLINNDGTLEDLKVKVEKIIYGQGS